MIEKIIHYCWFGHNEIPEELQKCIDSWSKYMPDYKIIRWDESNYDIKKCKYVEQAYNAKKWAFVSDYVRLDVCYKNGGIYLDTDVEVLKSFDDLLSLGAFAGREEGSKKNMYLVNIGLVFGLKKGLEIGRLLRDEYHDINFINDDGTYNLTPCPIIQSTTLKNYGLSLENVKETIHGLTIFPTEYFCPKNQSTGELLITDSTYSIHHYYGSWLSNLVKEKLKLRNKYRKYGYIPSVILSEYFAYKKEYGILKMWKKLILKHTQKKLKKYNSNIGKKRGKYE